jgi:hypothetical protein
MRTCAHCRHWQRVKNSVMGAGVGECRMWPPPQSFNWPRTRSEDGCAQWAGAADGADQGTKGQADFATGAAGTGQPAPAEGGGGPAGAVAPGAPRSTAPLTGAAMPARPARASRAGGKPGDVGRPALLQPDGGAKP